MLWSPICAALSQIARLSGITDPGSINWAGQPGATAAFGARRLVMKIGNVRALGVDYEHVDATTPNPTNLPQAVSVVGQRTFLWTVRCESTNADPAAFGLAYLDKLRARLRRSTTNAIMAAAGLALVDIHPTVEVQYLSQTRMISTYVMEVVMAAAENDLDDAADAGGFIDTANLLSNKLTGVDGVDAPMQITETVGPA